MFSLLPHRSSMSRAVYFSVLVCVYSASNSLFRCECFAVCILRTTFEYCPLTILPAFRFYLRECVCMVSVALRCYSFCFLSCTSFSAALLWWHLLCYAIDAESRLKCVKSARVAFFFITFNGICVYQRVLLCCESQRCDFVCCCSFLFLEFFRLKFRPNAMRYAGNIDFCRSVRLSLSH